MLYINIILCYATLCYATLRYATLRYATLRYATLRYATLRYATLRYAMLRYAMLCYVMLCMHACMCMHEQAPPPPPEIMPYDKRSPRRNTIYGKPTPGRNHMAVPPQGRNSTIIMIKLPPLW